ncbi:hypothetical protein CXF68_12240 [Tenacibaculum sp. Bg11-29]|uniref:hypothetical protein n=1 Tax=Tenacibaculum sp. Bg11-29 TaxID=2058306 RepID=UPI000C332A1D|nr:hypothetical protein [Tenacibaculum sp. Bg11-29]PKH51402.1 hypothetical protein CXF68_12240 [Tenacibaculum sp. Bg11-29]
MKEIIELVFYITGIISFLLLGYVLIKLIFTKKEKQKLNLDFKLPNFKFNYQWFFIIIFTILIAFTPWLFTREAIISDFDFSKTGDIGSTINGITAPFIAWLGAILIFITFREQVKANKSNRNQYNFDVISRNLTELQKQQSELTTICSAAQDDLSNDGYDTSNLQAIIENIRLFQNVVVLIEKMDENEDLLKSKAVILWENIYHPEIVKVNNRIVNIGAINGLLHLCGSPLLLSKDFNFVDEKIKEFKKTGIGL